MTLKSEGWNKLSISDSNAITHPVPARTRKNKAATSPPQRWILNKTGLNLVRVFTGHIVSGGATQPQGIVSGFKSDKPTRAQLRAPRQTSCVQVDDKSPNRTSGFGRFHLSDFRC